MLSRMGEGKFPLCIFSPFCFVFVLIISWLFSCVTNLELDFPDARYPIVIHTPSIVSCLISLYFSCLSFLGFPASSSSSNVPSSVSIALSVRRRSSVSAILSRLGSAVCVYILPLLVSVYLSLSLPGWLSICVFVCCYIVITRVATIYTIFFGLSSRLVPRSRSLQHIHTYIALVHRLKCIRYARGFQISTR